MIRAVFEINEWFDTIYERLQQINERLRNAAAAGMYVAKKKKGVADRSLTGEALGTNRVVRHNNRAVPAIYEHLPM